MSRVTLLAVVLYKFSPLTKKTTISSTLIGVNTLFFSQSDSKLIYWRVSNNKMLCYPTVESTNHNLSSLLSDQSATIVILSPLKVVILPTVDVIATRAVIATRMKMRKKATNQHQSTETSGQTAK